MKADFPTEYYVFSDESASSCRRYQSISSVSGPKSNLIQLRSELDGILKSLEISEVKFTKVKTTISKLIAAKEFFKLAVDEAASGNIRIDVLFWDFRDSRHLVKGRDDIANMERMYYKIIRLIGTKWNNVNWAFFPDEHSAINWAEINEYLNKTRVVKKHSEALPFMEERKRFFNFSKLKEQQSEKEPLVQLADLFAGFSWFSLVNGAKFLDWREQNELKKQPLLFPTDSVELDINKTTENRFELLNDFDKHCKEHKLGVSIRFNKHLHTFDNKNPINFWLYKPQTDFDKTPLKNTYS